MRGRTFLIVVLAASPVLAPASLFVMLTARNAFLRSPSSYTTALTRAAALGDAPEAERLLASGADVNERDRHGRRPLDAALHCRRPEIVRLLLAHGANVQEPRGALSPPLVSEAGANAESLKLLVKAGVDINARAGLTGQTALHIAALDGRLEQVKALVANGADVNAQASLDGRTPLHEAARRGQLPVAEFLVAHGANVNALCMRQTPRDMAWLNPPLCYPRVDAFLREHGGKRGYELRR